MNKSLFIIVHLLRLSLSFQTINGSLLCLFAQIKEAGFVGVANVRRYHQPELAAAVASVPSSSFT